MIFNYDDKIRYRNKYVWIGGGDRELLTELQRTELQKEVELLTL